MKRFLPAAAAAMVLFGCTPPEPPKPVAGEPRLPDQGSNWTPQNRAAYYTTDQGSRLMPIEWFRALRLPDGVNFLSGNLTRYGYLRNFTNSATDLPVGFTTNDFNNETWVGMSCAACHTRQIQVDKVEYRIDGGPAISDFQSFMTDIDAAFTFMLATPAGFTVFATDVLGKPPTEAELKDLRTKVELWFKPFDLIVQKGMPKANPWGPARLDAVGMIFDRVAGLDIGQSKDHIIASNIRLADAPVRYPFLWNASIQDMTQWPGFATNGDPLLGLTRNTGEVFGVFALFHPSIDTVKYPKMKVDYTTENSANGMGLLKLEDLIAQLGPPKWPFALNKDLADKGKEIFERSTATGGCAECHGEKPGKTRMLVFSTWATPLLDVGTDNREWTMLGVKNLKGWPGWNVQTGVLSGSTLVPGLTPPLKPIDSAFATLEASVGGSILQSIVNLADPAFAPNDKDAGPDSDLVTSGVHAHSGRVAEVASAFTAQASKPDPAPFKYEARVLKGIWAAAPYLHNGSVPTLEDLLKPAAQRPAAFAIGSNYDTAKVGLAAEQPDFNYTLKTTDCAHRTSGDSNCGHEYGTTQLTPDEKTALLEYLKKL